MILVGNESFVVTRGSDSIARRLKRYHGLEDPILWYIGRGHGDQQLDSSMTARYLSVSCLLILCIERADMLIGW